MTEKIDFNPPNTTNAKKKNSILKNLTDTHSTTSIETELLTQIKQMKEENEKLKKELQNYAKAVEEGKKLKDRVKEQNKEIAILEEKLNLYDSAQAKNEEEFVEEIKTEFDEKYKEKVEALTNQAAKLSNELSAKTAAITSLEVKVSDDKQTIDNLNNLIKNLQDQITKRNANDLFEIDGLMEKVAHLETEKEEQSQKIKELTEQLNNYSTNYSTISTVSSSEINGIPEYKKALSKLKLELKAQTKKNEETKLELENQVKKKEILIVKSEEKVKELESTVEIIVAENDELKKENDNLIENLKKFGENVNNKEENSEISKLKAEIEKIKKESETQINELNQKINENNIMIEKYKNLEIVYKQQLNDKNKDTESKTSFINEIQTCLNKQIDDNLKLKQENIQFGNEKKNFTKKIEELKEKISKLNSELGEKKTLLEKTTNELNESIKKKKKIISIKKKENVILADIVILKRSEIQCIEALQYVQSDSIKENLDNLREKEKNGIKEIEELTNDPYYTDDSIEDDSLDLEGELNDNSNDNSN